MLRRRPFAGHSSCTCKNDLSELLLIEAQPLERAEAEGRRWSVAPAENLKKRSSLRDARQVEPPTAS